MMPPAMKNLVKINQVPTLILYPVLLGSVFLIWIDFELTLLCCRCFRKRKNAQKPKKNYTEKKILC